MSSLDSTVKAVDGDTIAEKGTVWAESRNVD